MHRRNFLQNSLLASATLSLPSINAPELKKKDSFDFAFISDVHIKPSVIAEEGMKKALRHVNADKKIEFIINGGDAIMDALKASKEKVQIQWNLWSNILQAENKLPVYHCIGNHDIWGWQMNEPSIKTDPLYDKKWVLQQHKMQERFYAFEKGNWKFIVLDSVQENNGGYIARIDETQFIWLENELKNTSININVCIVSHIPIVSFCAAMFSDKNEANGDWRISRALLHVDNRMLIELFKSFSNIKCCLSGHIHLHDAVEYNGITYYCNGAVSGNWWNGAFKGFEPAYAKFSFYKDGTFKRSIIKY